MQTSCRLYDSLITVTLAYGNRFADWSPFIYDCNYMLWATSNKGNVSSYHQSYINSSSACKITRCFSSKTSSQQQRGSDHITFPQSHYNSSIKSSILRLPQWVISTTLVERSSVELLASTHTKIWQRSYWQRKNKEKPQSLGPQSLEALFDYLTYPAFLNTIQWLLDILARPRGLLTINLNLINEGFIANMPSLLETLPAYSPFINNATIRLYAPRRHKTLDIYKDRISSIKMVDILNEFNFEKLNVIIGLNSNDFLPMRLAAFVHGIK